MSKQSPQRVVLVTGSSRGIGRAIAGRLASAGFSLAIHGTEGSRDALEALAQKLSRQCRVGVFPCDLRHRAAELVPRVVEEMGGLYGLVNNAGVVSSEPAWAVRQAELERVFAINTFAPILLGGAAYEVMVTAGMGGRIVNISSAAVRFGSGRNNSVHYAASKAALEATTTGYARIGAKHRILANTVRPGVIDTDIQKQRAGLDERVALIPVQRMGTPEEIAAMVEFLLSDEAAFITGQTISVAGGE